MAKKVPIKPGCLCIVLKGFTRIPEVVGPGDIVTAVRYRGRVTDTVGETMQDVWQITNKRIEVDIQYEPGMWIGASAKLLQPISDPDQEPALRREQQNDKVDMLRQQEKLLRHVANYGMGTKKLTKLS